MARTDRLQVLAKLERQRLDERRGMVVAAQGEEQRLAAEAAAHGHAWTAAIALAATTETALAFWGGIARGTRAAMDGADMRRRAQALELEQAQAALHASLVEHKRLEVLAARRAMRRAAARDAAERRMVDELAVLRHGRPGG